MPKFKTQFNHDRLEGTKFIEPSLTEPQFDYECDINNIVKGCVTTLNHMKPDLSYVDDTTYPTLEQAMNTITKARSDFEQLPSDLRAEFDNNPMNLVKFLGDSKNTQRAIELGLVNPPVEQPKEVIPQTEKSGESST